MLISEYYGEIQAISARAALWQLIVGADDPANMLIYLGRHFLKDMIHVTPFGHRWWVWGSEEGKGLGSFLLGATYDWAPLDLLMTGHRLTCS